MQEHTPKRQVTRMKSGANADNKITEQELKTLINQALQKISGKRENDICRYLPGESGGYMHHFTYRKKKGESPEELAELIRSCITDCTNPSPIPPKARAPRGSRRRRDQPALSKNDLERMWNLARLAGDKEMMRKLTPREDLKTLKRKLIASIRQNRLDQDLWNQFVEAISNQNQGGEEGSIPSSQELLNALSQTMSLAGQKQDSLVDSITS